MLRTHKLKLNKIPKVTLPIIYVVKIASNLVQKIKNRQFSAKTFNSEAHQPSPQLYILKKRKLERYFGAVAENYQKEVHDTLNSAHAHKFNFS